jgi:hypothetical protein
MQPSIAIFRQHVSAFAERRAENGRGVDSVDYVVPFYDRRR